MLSEQHVLSCRDGLSSTIKTKNSLQSWLISKKHILGSEKPTRNLKKLLCAITSDTGLKFQDCTKAYDRFLTSLLTKPQHALKLYTGPFSEFLTSHQDEIRDIYENPKSSFVHTFLRIISHLFRLRIKIYSYQDGVVRWTKIGNPFSVTKICLLENNRKYTKLIKERLFEPKIDLELIGSLSSEELSLGMKKLSEVQSQKSNSDAVSTFADEFSKEKCNSIQSEHECLSISSRHPISTTSKIQPKAIKNFRFIPYPTNMNRMEENDDSIHEDNLQTEEFSVNSELSQFSKFESNKTTDEHEKSSMMSSTARSKDLIHKKFKEKVLEEDQTYKRGVIKFFSHSKEYGFIISEGKEYFLHKDDLVKAGFSFQESPMKNLQQQCVEFRMIKYQGKSKVGFKAIDIKLI